MDQEHHLAAGERLGQYRIVRLLGRGGMGAVYEAEHDTLRTRYALKLLPLDFAARPDAIERFKLEARVMANLHHPHIVKVDDFGDTHGRYWLRMELVPGLTPDTGTLAQLATQCGGRIPQTDFAPLFRQVLQAVAHAHEQAILHRDLKPANILLQPGPDGQPQVKVSDFGLARIVGEESLRTQAERTVAQSLGEMRTVDGSAAAAGTSTRAILGTWEFMSPEQKRSEEATPRSDVFALGLIAFRLLTGADPGLEPASQLVPDLCAEWDAFLAKALKQNRDERYANAGEMLQAFSAVEHAVRNAKPTGAAAPRRLPLWALGATAVLVCLIGLALWTRLHPSTPSPTEIFPQLGHVEPVPSVAFSPDGKLSLSGSYDKTLKLWDVVTGREVRTFTGHSNRVVSVAFSPDGKLALSGSWDNTLKLWDVATGLEVRTFTGRSNSVTSVAFSPDGKLALSGCWDSTLKLWDVVTGREVRTFTGHSNSVCSVAFSPDSKFALSGSFDHTIKLWDVVTGLEMRTFTGHSNWVYSMAFSPDGKLALSGSGHNPMMSGDNTLELWDVATGLEIRTFGGHSSRVISVAFSPDGKLALSGSEDETLNLKLWDVGTGRELRTFTGHSSGVSSVAFSPDGKLAFSGSWDSTLKLWDVATGLEVRTFTGATSHKYLQACFPDSKLALSGSENRPLKLWDLVTGCEVRTFIGHSNNVGFSSVLPGRQACPLLRELG